MYGSQGGHSGDSLTASNGGTSMGLSQSLYTGYSGLVTHQRGMDIIGNNLANTNTAGYRQSQLQFSNLFNQAISAGTAADGDRSTTNPKHVGMGVGTGATRTNFAEAPREQTGNPYDVAINGNGFFMVSTPRGTALTRAGSFYPDLTNDPNQRTLMAGDGLSVLGWNAVDGVITPSQNVGSIYIPARGVKMVGEPTTEVELNGILPTNTSGDEFSGSETTVLELKGNLPAGESSLTTTVYMPVTRNGGDNPISDEKQAVKVRIDFTGPTVSEDGTTDSYGWTMTTVDWPNVGDEGIQIYPASDGRNESVNFHTQGSTTDGYGAGQAKTEKLEPGSTRVESVTQDEDGNDVATFFVVPSNFSIDVSRLTHLASAPGGNELETWYVNGNPTGTMARTVSVNDQETAFEAVTNENGITTMEPVKTVQVRQNNIFFQREEQTNEGSTWSWQSSLGGDSGTLTFDTHGELASSEQTGSRIQYTFGDIKSINHEGSLQIANQDGYRDGFMEDFTIDSNGKIWAHYSNDVDTAVAQIAMGNVQNASGLINSSGTLFYASAASGDIMVGIAGDEGGDLGLPPIGAGSLSSHVLEGSNVELAREFTNMIAIERGYQFSSRIVSTSNEMLQTALGLKT